MKKYSNMTVGVIGSIALALMSQSASAEQKYTVPSTPGAANTHTMPSGNNNGHNMQHTQGGSMQHTQGGSMQHMQGGQAGHNMPNYAPVIGPAKAKKMPTETGQSAFAAIAEIVAILNADPNTDWSKINISALRAHLVDMNEVTMKADAAQTVKANSVTFTVTGKGCTLRAIQAMVIAHSRELDKIDGWKVSASKVSGGAVMIISSDSKAIVTKIKALGFFGVMAMGAHHQPHHFGMAKGQMIHQH